ncbi:MAG: hypothetical protein U1E46_03660 [Hyphomicrobiales bacterium]
MNRAIIALSAVTICATAPASAASFNIYGTGLASDGTLLAKGAVDPHYTTQREDSVTTGTASVINFAGVFPNAQFPGANPADWDCNGTGINCNWVANGPNSQWIGITGEELGLPENIAVTFTTTFDLTGFDPASAIINGAWATDDRGLEVKLNGVAVPGLTLLQNDNTVLDQLNPFSITTGFVQGVNTLQFTIKNLFVGGGFRTDLSGTANVIPLPPAAYLFSGGLLALISFGRRRQTRSL